MESGTPAKPENAVRQATLRLVAASGAAPRAVKARDISLLETDSVEDAAVCILSNTLDQFVANVPVFRMTEAPESVHQMRVGLRRLRAAAGLFRRVLGGEELEAARARAKTIAATLGAARDWDVFRDMLEHIPRARFDDESSFFALLDAVELRRRAGYRDALALLDAPQTRAFVDDLRRLLAARGWRRGQGADAPGSARAFASETLTRLRKRVVKKSRGLATLTADERHEVRIALKKARYASEFFHSLFAHRGRARAFGKALAQMQDGLGVYNDMATANRLLDEIESAGDARISGAAGFVRGWFAHAAQAGDAHAEESETRLRELKPYWK